MCNIPQLYTVNIDSAKKKKCQIGSGIELRAFRFDNHNIICEITECILF